MQMNKNLIIMCGMPRSGKSPYVDRYYSDYSIVCADDIRLAMGFQFNPNCEPLVWAQHGIILRSLLIRGKNVVIDSTNLNIKRIEDYCKLGLKYGYKNKLIIINTPKNICLERNIGEGAVSEQVIDRMETDLNLILETAHDYYEAAQLYEILTVEHA